MLCELQSRPRRHYCFAWLVRRCDSFSHPETGREQSFDKNWLFCITFTSCCSAFHSSVVKVHRSELARKPSLFPVYSIHSNRHFARLFTVDVVSHTLRGLSRGFLANLSCSQNFCFFSLPSYETAPLVLRWHKKAMKNLDGFV